MKSGDLVFCHTNGVIGKSIRWAQRNEGDGRFSKWNHVAVLDRLDSNGHWLVIQAEPKGVTNDKCLGTLGVYEIVPLPNGVDAEKFLRFVRSQVGHRYGYLSIFSCALDMYLPDSVCLRQAKTWICSGLVAAALMFAGFEPAMSWSDIYTNTPAGLAHMVSAT
jgi:hypothetical protein